MLFRSEEVVINGPEVRQENESNMLSNFIPGGYGTVPDEEQSVLPDLESITLYNLQKAKIIYKGGCLQQLCSLSISYCRRLEYLITCANDEGEEKQVIIEAFPKLKNLDLQGLLQLKSFSTGRYLLSFPSLEILKVIDCLNLNKFEMTAKNLKEIRGKKKWWNEIEWGVKEKFRPLFRPLR